MATVNQRIPNFLGGVSQQPDKIKFPGQLRVCDNAVPDITFGLKKRPPAEFVGTLSNANTSGHWYEILRDGDEKYIVQITPSLTGSMPIRVWDLADGTEKSLTNSSGDSVFSYLAGATSPYAVTTIQDYTLIANPNKVVGTTGTTAAPIDNGNYSYARLDTVAYNTEYILYTGTAPTPNTFYRVTSVKVDRMNGNTAEGPTWNDTNENQQKSGTLTWSFSGGSAVTTTGAQVGGTNITENIEGTLQVNGNSYIANNVANFNGNSTSSSDFLGYTQDYDIRYTATVTLRDGGLIKTTNKSTAEGLFIDVTIEGIPYRVSVEAVEPVTTYQDVSGIAYHKTPKNPENGAISMATILNGLKSSVNSDLSNVTAEVIGSGLFLHGSAASGVNFLGGAVNENMSVIGQKAQDVSRLPAMCKQGYIAKIANTADLDTDDYYVKFIADNGVSGVGSWEECVRPQNFTSNLNINYNWTQSGNTITVTQVSGNHNFEVGEEVYLTFTGGSPPANPKYYTIETVTNNSFTFTTNTTQNQTGSGLTVTVSTDHMHAGLDPATMPHALINNRNGTFTFVKLDFATASSQGNQNYWKDREVGDNTSNPFPTITGSTIQKMFFHRNRLGLISGEQVVMSQPGQYFNLFIVSAITASDDNPIDITVSDVKPAFINHTLPIQKGLLMFSDNGQFMLFTESDIFSPKTVRLKKISSYECDNTIQPVDLGTSVLFTSNVSAYARAFEATILDDDVPPNIIEQTRVVPEFLPKDINKSTNSAAIGITSYCKTGTSNIYHYKYYNAGNQREQSAWYTWTVKGTLLHTLYTGGLFYTVTFYHNQYILSRHEYVADNTANNAYQVGEGTVGSPTTISRRFEPCLDYLVAPTAITASVPNDNTTLDIPYAVNPGEANLVQVLCISGNDTDGDSLAGSVFTGVQVIPGQNKIIIPKVKISSSAKLMVGFRYTTIISLPTYYYNVGQNAYDLEGDLRISGINFELGVSGPMEFHLTSPFSYVDSSGNVTKDIDDYIQYETGMITGSSTFNNYPAELTKSVRVPIQRKNNKYDLEIKVTDPFSIALISASWDGIYNQKRHVRR